jgi:RNA polymerase sigma-70 factor (ECF subfamily)
MAALNRTYALSKTRGRLVAIAEAEKLQLSDNHFYFVLLGELYKGIDDQKSKQYFQEGLSLARTKNDREAIQKKIAEFS